MNLSFPLYHGTSTYFLESIKMNGLGGRNLIKDLKAIEFLKDLEKLCDINLSTIEKWQYGLKYPISLITSQRVVHGGNFQNGSVYLTPSIYTATRYSKNKFGSEVLSEIFNTLNLLREYSIALPKELEMLYRQIIELESREFRPVVIEIPSIPISYLCSDEKGGSVESQIMKIEKYVNDYGIDRYQGFVQQNNFRTDKVIPLELLIIKNVA